jgi:glycosyltransferase involved in cell wall biosynthesis
MPVHNGALYLDEALASLAAQTFRDFEIVVVDNASTDETPGMLARWAAREPRLRTLRLERNRLSASLNEAARMARAPILARLDADDVARPDRFERQMAALARHPEVGLLGSSAILVDRRGRPLGEIRPPRADKDIRQRHRTSCGIIPSSSIMRAEAFWGAGGYREGLNISEDFDLWLRMGERCTFANLPEPLISYRVHTGSVTARQPVRMALASFCVTAAAEARRTGQREPFRDGRPSLRAALPLLGLSRRDARKIVRYRSLSNMMSRRLLGLPLPPFLRALSPKLVTQLRLRPLYQAWLRRRLEGG